MVINDDLFDYSQLKSDFATNLEQLSELICSSIDESGENRPLEDYLSLIKPLYFSTFNNYLEFLLLFLFSKTEIRSQKLTITSVSILPRKDFLFSNNEIIVLPETIQSFFSVVWNHYSFSFEEFFLSEQLLEEKMYFNSLNEELEELIISKKFETSKQNLEFILLRLNLGLDFLHQSICIRERFYRNFLENSGLDNFQVDFFRLILSLDYGVTLLTLEILELKIKYNKLCELK